MRWASDGPAECRIRQSRVTDPGEKLSAKRESEADRCLRAGVIGFYRHARLSLRPLRAPAVGRLGPVAVARRASRSPGRRRGADAARSPSLGPARLSGRLEGRAAKASASRELRLDGGVVPGRAQLLPGPDGL